MVVRPARFSSGFYFAPAQFEAAFVSTAHTPADIDRTVEAAGDALQEVLVCR